MATGKTRLPRWNSTSGTTPCGSPIPNGSTSRTGATKLDLAQYYLSVGDGIVRALRERPCMMHRFPEGLTGERCTRNGSARGAALGADGAVVLPRYKRHADELCVTELASVIWAVQMSTVEFHPWNSRRADTEKPDEWRIDLDPMPECDFDTVRRVARMSPTRCSTSSAPSAGRRRPAARACTSTSGSSRTGVSPTSAGPRWPSPGRWSAATPQRCDDHLVAQGPRPGEAVRRLQPERPGPHDRQRLLGARRSATRRCRRRSRWDEIDDVEPRTSPWRPSRPAFAELGDLHAGIDDAVFSIEPLLRVGGAGRAGRPPGPGRAGRRRDRLTGGTVLISRRAVLRLRRPAYGRDLRPGGRLVADPCIPAQREGRP